MKSQITDLLDELIKLHPKYIDLSLSRLNKLLKKLGDPHLDLPKTIHIAGTNGKGSVQSFIRNILVSSGYSCDAYISPHLTKFNERIILKNKEVSTKKLLETLKFVKNINNDDPITFFEITTAAAFVLFQRTRSDFLILETGLGGRLDATNVVPKKICSIITPISYDHEEFLGNTILKITKEKLGIIKNNDFILISKQRQDVNNYIKKKLSKLQNVYFYGKDYKISKIIKNKFELTFNKNKTIYYNPKLNGQHQIENASVAIAFSKIIKVYDKKIKLKNINNAIKNTFWPGRLEVLNYNNKKIILDGSHNVDGAKKLNQFLKLNKINPDVIFGMLNNKKINDFLKLIRNQIKKLVAIKIPDENNAFSTNEISKQCELLSIKNIEVKNINEVLKYIKSSDQKVLLITGSLYLVGKIRNRLL